MVSGMSRETEGLCRYLEWLLPAYVYWRCWALGPRFLHQPRCAVRAGISEFWGTLWKVAYPKGRILFGCLTSHTFLRSQTKQSRPGKGRYFCLLGGLHDVDLSLKKNKLWSKSRKSHRAIDEGPENGEPVTSGEL